MPMSVESVAAQCRSFIKAFHSFYHYLRGSLGVISNSRDVLATLNVSFQLLHGVAPLNVQLITQAEGENTKQAI